MEETPHLESVALVALRKRITEVLPSQIRSCIEELDEEQLWWRPNEQSNSIGNLVLHVRGSMLHFLYRAVGGFEYERDRASEFSERGPFAKEELLARLDDVVEKAKRTFDLLNPSRLAEPSPEPRFNSILFEDLLGVAVHLATHTGQIVYITKMLKEGSLDELWMQAHRRYRAWKS